MQGLASMSAPYATGSRPGKLASGVVIAGIHVAAVVALLQLEPVRSAITSAAPIMVSLIEPAKRKLFAPPKPLPPNPFPVQREVHKPQPAPAAPAPVLA